MNEPVAWCYENEETRTIYYVNPAELEGGILPPEGEPILLYEGWEDRLKAFEETLGEGWRSKIIADGEYDRRYVGLPFEEPKDSVTILADRVRKAINSV